VCVRERSAGSEPCFLISSVCLSRPGAALIRLISLLQWSGHSWKVCTCSLLKLSLTPSYNLSQFGTPPPYIPSTPPHSPPSVLLHLLLFLSSLHPKRRYNSLSPTYTYIPLHSSSSPTHPSIFLDLLSLFRETPWRCL
jgi:hypothetical protein